jgi:hypothetical protein
MARLTVQVFQDGKPVGEYVFTSKTKSEQEMADWMQANRKPGIELRFLGHYGIIKPA